MTNLMKAYLELEGAMLALDGQGDERADLVRDIMDSLWQDLGYSERAYLDSRGEIK